jgi:uncharacterized membrane protein YqjE
MPLELTMPNRRLSRFRLRVSLVLLSVGGFAFLVMIALGQHVLGLVSLCAAVLGVLMGKNRLVCPSCGKTHLAIAAEVRCCHDCGASYFPEVSKDEATA